MDVTPALAPSSDEIVELRPRQALQHTLARWVSGLRPDWYPTPTVLSASLEHEFAQAGSTAKIWVVVQNTRPRAWLWARRVPDGRAQVEIVRMGGEIAGRYESAAPACAPLLARAATWAADGGARLLVHWTSSEGLAIHGRPLADLASGMEGLGGGDSPAWAFWVEQGFMLWGLLPQLYGPGQHGALLARPLDR